MGNKIREYRKKKKMTQTELAKKSGVSRVTISQLENGLERNTSSSTLLALAKALDSTVDQIFFSDRV